MVRYGVDGGESANDMSGNSDEGEDFRISGFRFWILAYRRLSGSLTFVGRAGNRKRDETFFYSICTVPLQKLDSSY